MSKFNFIGRRFGHLQVIKETRDKKGKLAWLCKCDCENQTEVIVDSYRLNNGIKTHCGCRKQRKSKATVTLPDKYTNKIKTCNTCNEEKLYREYYFRNNTKDEGETDLYFNPRCIECCKNLSTKNIKNNRERHLVALQKNNKRKNIIKIKREYSKKKIENGKLLEYQRNNKDKIKSYNQKRSNQKHDITKEEWTECKKYFNFQCAYCGMSEIEHKELYSQQLHKEHVIHDGYNNLSNCVPSCKICNSEKNIKLLEDWYNIEKDIFSQERMNKINLWLTEDYLKIKI